MNAQGFTFNAESIKRNAPANSGVYAIYNSGRWIYVGESNDIQRRLLQHWYEEGTCIKLSAPTGFSYELHPSWLRVGRQNQLIQQLHPACNRMFG
jgi:hypothetical protein